MQPISVAFVDDHPILLDTLVSLFAPLDQFDVKAVGTCADDALSIAAKDAPDILLMDVSMPGDAFQAIRTLKGQKTKVVAFTASNSVDQAVKALQAGASGYLLKDTPVADLIGAIQAIQSGALYISPVLASRVMEAFVGSGDRKADAAAVNLTHREEQILRLLLKGYTNKRIAGEISMSEKTVKNNMSLLTSKLGVNSRLELMLVAKKLFENAVESRPLH